MEQSYFTKEVQTAYEKLQHPMVIFQFVGIRMIAVVVSDGFCEMLDYENREQAYEDLNQNLKLEKHIEIHPDDIARIKSEAYRFATEKEMYDVFFRIRKKDETVFRVIHAMGRHIYTEDKLHFAHMWFMAENNEMKKIKELQTSMASLLENMPAMTFSKDVVTGRYLACNQFFAEYAHKETPAGVVGLTDYEIFDWATAEHFVQDDKKALSMEKPFIFFEEVPDAAGNVRQFQTTKLKFVDASGRECLLGLCQDVTDAMLIKKEYDQRLEQARTKANIDTLTGIRNKSAYVEEEEKVNRELLDYPELKFAVTIFDVNDLKKVNDSLGHQAGDVYICGACKIICRTFKHSPVFRIGGDEFVAISKGEDYEHLQELMDYMKGYNENALKTGGIVIACGTARREQEGEVSEVFHRADQKMYENKKYLKNRS